MSENEEKEKIKKMAKLRAVLEKRMETLEAELDELKTLLELIDSTLIEEGFKRNRRLRSPLLCRRKGVFP
jgi:hypothetical protein